MVVTEFVGALKLDNLVSTQEWEHNPEYAKRHPNFATLLFQLSHEDFIRFRYVLIVGFTRITDFSSVHDIKLFAF